MLPLWALAGAAQAADVLLLDATPVSVDDFSIAGLFYGMVTSAADDAGLDYEDADTIRKWAGNDADTCADQEDCPANLWERTDARLAVVMSVGQTPKGLEITVALHGVEEAGAFKALRQVVAPGQEMAYAATIAKAAKDALPLLPERKPVASGVLVIEDETITGELPDLDDEPPPRTEPGRTRSEPTERATKPETPPERTKPERPTKPEKPEKTERSPVARLGSEEEQRKMGIPDGAYSRYTESGKPSKTWLADNRVRSGHVFLELEGGYTLGDVDRGYGVRLRVEDAGNDAFQTVATSTWEGNGASAAPGFGFALGYAPTWFLDTSVQVAVQYGRKHLNTGWECLQGCDPPASEYTHDPVSAVQAILEPRIRVYPVATGLVKPYALVGFAFLFHDGFEVPDPDFGEYPDTAPGASFGPTGGVGLSVDAASRFSVYAEVPATLLLAQPVESGAADVTLTPDSLESSGYLLRITGGLTIRL